MCLIRWSKKGMNSVTPNFKISNEVFMKCLPKSLPGLLSIMTGFSSKGIFLKLIYSGDIYTHINRDIFVSLL